ncbi:hypothetical protein AYI68_g2674 [Smittium mucronatum]|uniref:Nucleotide exchange factor SIL1 n=1 Tax=Smittium mucronatum TaxID=133383 RepID=A0A1R0H220_9FUNG|nr:hypothetical protein AYI68_g2674 [Smittium mucronatum]
MQTGKKMAKILVPEPKAEKINLKILDKSHEISSHNQKVFINPKGSPKNDESENKATFDLVVVDTPEEKKDPVEAPAPPADFLGTGKVVNHVFENIENEFIVNNQNIPSKNTSDSSSGNLKFDSKSFHKMTQSNKGRLGADALSEYVEFFKTKNGSSIDEYLTKLSKLEELAHDFEYGYLIVSDQVVYGALTNTSFTTKFLGSGVQIDGDGPNSLNTLKSKHASILGAAFQNNIEAKKHAYTIGAVPQLLRMLEESSSVDTHGRIVYALSGLVVGYDEAVRAFEQSGGLDTIMSLYINYSHPMMLSLDSPKADILKTPFSLDQMRKFSWLRKKVLSFFEDYFNPDMRPTKPSPAADSDNSSIFDQLSYQPNVSKWCQTISSSFNFFPNKRDSASGFLFSEKVATASSYSLLSEKYPDTCLDKKILLVSQS